MNDHRTDDSLRGRLMRLAAPVAERVLSGGPVVPSEGTRWLYRAAFEVDAMSRDVRQWARRSFLATPMLLSRCAVHGDNVTADAPPRIEGKCRIEIGSDVHISGGLEVQSGVRAGPILTLGNDVAIGSGCVFRVANRIDIGDHVSIGERTFISDTAEPSLHLGKPGSRDQAGTGDVEGVTIEDSVRIGRECVIVRGVRIGARSVIEAGSVVRSDVQPDAIMAGNPARVVGWRRNASGAAAVRRMAAPRRIGSDIEGILDTPPPSARVA